MLDLIHTHLFDLITIPCTWSKWLAQELYFEVQFASFWKRLKFDLFANFDLWWPRDFNLTNFMSTDIWPKMLQIDLRPLFSNCKKYLNKIKSLKRLFRIIKPYCDFFRIKIIIDYLKEIFLFITLSVIFQVRGQKSLLFEEHKKADKRLFKNANNVVVMMMPKAVKMSK